jgi:SNF2 family DNA or RNA helicase
MTKPLIYRDHIVVPDDERLRFMVPHAKRFEHEGQQLLLIPNKLDEAQVLRNLGYDVRPPIMTSYQWSGDTPFDSQKITAALITTHKRCFVFNGIGTGKTRASLYAYDYMRSTNAVEKMLVVAPLSTLRQTWLREITLYFPHLVAVVLHGSKAKRTKLLAQPADIYIINHDGVEVMQRELQERPDISYCVLDELSVYKRSNTDLWKKTNAVVKNMDRVVGMTATPMPLEPADAYGQIKMINPGILKGQSFTRFRDEVMLKLTDYKYVPRRGAVDEVFAKMQPSVRFTRDECYDMPPCQIVTREAMLTPEQERAYKTMAEHCAIEIDAIKAGNEADRINKLVQIALGTVYNVEHDVVELPCAPRLKLLDDAIEQSASKVIVFTPYKSSLAKLVKHVSQRWTTAFISGDVSTHQREQIFTMFMNSPDPQVLLAHPATMSHGLTLTEASTIVWYGPPSSLEMYEQANGRITRAGQKHSQLIINVAATKLEAQIYRRLETRAAVQGVLLDLFESQELGDLL